QYVNGITVLHNRARDIALAAYDDVAAADAIVNLAKTIHGTNTVMVARTLNSEAEMLYEYWCDRGSYVHLNAVIAVRQKSLEAASSNDERGVANANLGTVLRTRFEHLGAPADLDAAIDHTQEALALTPSDSPDRAGILDNLGTVLRTR